MRSNRRGLRVLAVVAVLGVIAAACSKKTSGGGGNTSGSGGSKPTVKIEFFGALSGDYKLLVISGFQGAQLAFDQANAAGDLPVNIVFEGQDTGGSGDQATPLAQKVVNDSSVVGIIGPAFSGESAATGDLFNQAGLPFVTPSATDDALSTHGWTTWFRGVGNNSDEARPAAAYIEAKYADTCTFVASDGSAYGHGLAAIVYQKLSDDGAQVEKEEQVAQGQKDYSALVTKIKSSGCGVVFYGGYSPEAGLIRKQMTDAGLGKVVMLGGDGIKDDTFLGAAGNAGEGTLSVCPCADLSTDTSQAAVTFLADYKAKFGETAGIYGPEGYDIATMYIAAMKAGDTTRQSLSNYFRNLTGYQGLTKVYAWQPNGELFVSSRQMFVYADHGGFWSFLGNAADLAAGG